MWGKKPDNVDVRSPFAGSPPVRRSIQVTSPTTVNGITRLLPSYYDRMLLDNLTLMTDFVLPASSMSLSISSSAVFSGAMRFRGRAFKPTFPREG
jgi:hypothetical protein